MSFRKRPVCFSDDPADRSGRIDVDAAEGAGGRRFPQVTLRAGSD